MAARIPRVLAEQTRLRVLGGWRTTMKSLGLLPRRPSSRDNWDPPVSKELLNAEPSDGPVGDYSHLSGTPAFGGTAVNLQLDILQLNCELLLARYAGGGSLS